MFCSLTVALLWSEMVLDSLGIDGGECSNCWCLQVMFCLLDVNRERTDSLLNTLQRTKRDQLQERRKKELFPLHPSPSLLKYALARPFALCCSSRTPHLSRYLGPQVSVRCHHLHHLVSHKLLILRTPMMPENTQYVSQVVSLDTTYVSPGTTLFSPAY